MVNANPTTGVRYGYISADSLDSEILDELLYGSQAVDVRYRDACEDLEASVRNATEDFLSRSQQRALIDYALELFELECDEPIHEGEYQGVRYRTSWLGGALHVWVFESPVVGNYAECSPCVPGAGNLDCPDLEGVVCYDVPEDWRMRNA